MRTSALLLLLTTLLLSMASCSGRQAAADDPAQFTDTFYSPRYASGFVLRSAAGDSTRLMLEVDWPRPMRIMIPEGGFRSVICMSSTYVGLLDAVGAADRITGVSSKDYLTDSEVKSRVADVGYEGAMDYERLLACKPDIALIYGIGGESAIAGKLDELGVRYVYVNDFMEQDPLGKAEWMVALAALTGQDGRPAFDAVAEAYAPVQGGTAVMLNAPYSGAWFIPGMDNYMTRLVADAGGRIIAPQPQGAESKPIDMEVAVPALNRAEVWLNPGQASTAAQARALVPQADFCGRIWNQTPDFYESGAAHPDRVIRELQSIFSSTAADTLRYFSPLR